MKFSVRGSNDKKQYFEITFGVPLWLTKRIGVFQYWLRKQLFKLRPFRCNVCGKKQNVRSPQYELVFENGSRLMVENIARNREVSTAYKPHCVCRECLANELETGVWHPRFGPSRENYRFWSKKKCDVTGAMARSYKDVEILPHVDMVFCTLAWNYGRVSKEAVIRCVREGRITTSQWGVYKGKMAMMNGKGLYVNENGELL